MPILNFLSISFLYLVIVYSWSLIAAENDCGYPVFSQNDGGEIPSFTVRGSVQALTHARETRSAAFERTSIYHDKNIAKKISGYFVKESIEREYHNLFGYVEANKVRRIELSFNYADSDHPYEVRMVDLQLRGRLNKPCAKFYQIHEFEVFVMELRIRNPLMEVCWQNPTFNSSRHRSLREELLHVYQIEVTMLDYLDEYFQGQDAPFSLSLGELRYLCREWYLDIFRCWKVHCYLSRRYAVAMELSTNVHLYALSND